MTLKTLRYPGLRSVALAAMWLFPLTAYPQTTLTGAIQFSTNSTGTFSGGQVWNTLPLDGSCCYALWLAMNPDATSPVNGPSDAQAGIAIPLEVGNSYKYYIFAQPNTGFSFNGLNLFFDGNNSTPGISVFGAINSSNFRPNSSSTLMLKACCVAGSGTTSYSADGVIVVLTGYDFNTPATSPGDVCQAYAFTPAPGDVLSFFGSFTLQVYAAAALSLSQTSGSPGTKLTATGSGFAPAETVDIYAGHIGVTPLSTTTTDASGSFTVTPRVPSLPYGPIDFYAVGLSSGKVGVATLSVTPGLLMSPGTGAPGGTTTAHVLGFGASETVDVYWNNPRQLLGAATADAVGSGALTFTIPATASPGINGVIGVGQTTKAIGIGGVTVE